MTALEFLQDINDINERINVISKDLEDTEEIERLYEMANRATTSFSGMPSYRDPQSREKLLVKLVDLRYSVNELIDKYVDKKLEAYRLFMKFSRPIFVDIMICRHIKSMKWNEMEKKMHYSERHLQRLEDEAIRELDAILAEEYPDDND